MDYLRTSFNMTRDITQSLDLKYPEDIRKVRDIVKSNMDLYFSEMPHVKKFQNLTGCSDIGQAVYCLDMCSWNTNMAAKYFKDNAVKVNLQ